MFLEDSVRPGDLVSIFRMRFVTTVVPLPVGEKNTIGMEWNTAQTV